MLHNKFVLVVSVSILCNEHVLLIKENKPTANNKWNFPSGRIEYNEDILEAAHREVKEETGLEIKLTGTTGVYQFMSSTNNQVFLFHFIAEVTGGALSLEEDEIVDAKWFKVNKLSELKEEELREAGVFNQMVQNLLSENIHSIELFDKYI
ncbi:MULTISPECIES: NUDIX hydrolase [Bacillaceae]|uniref:NUDIX hydrolase n=1 Tax=Bacillaceae TaxID=186817 RepID=UPI000BFD2CBE|nr:MULTISPECIES: NUDIX hydrolase [Bacillaceae]PGT75340.1 DNA mismatch repair protein MutT [Bacillus sp. AFS040349]UGB28886.1 NUDIX hydrolase [Metabacillus sp. B2-18]